MISLRSFTKEDWYGYAGATSFPNGSEPLIGELTVRDDDGRRMTAVAVLDSEQFCVQIMGEDEGEDYLDVFVSFEGMYAARAVAMLQDGLTLTELRAMPGAEELQ